MYKLCWTSISEWSKSILATVRHVEEPILVFIFLIDCRHHCSCSRHINTVQVRHDHVWNKACLSFSLPVGGRMFATKTNMAFSALSLILLRTTYTNCPTVKSAGTRYLQFLLQVSFRLRPISSKGKQVGIHYKDIQ